MNIAANANFPPVSPNSNIAVPVNQAAYVERRTHAWKLLQIVEAMEADANPQPLRIWEAIRRFSASFRRWRRGHLGSD
jgi:hypothetical protein